MLFEERLIFKKKKLKYLVFSLTLIDSVRILIYIYDILNFKTLNILFYIILFV